MPRKRQCICALRIQRSWLVPCAAILLAMFTLVPNLSAQEPVIAPLATALSKSISASGRKTAAVVDFTDLQGCVTELGRYLAEDLSVALAGDAKGFEVIDRTNLKVILQEHHLAATGIIDPDTARELGQIAGVDTLVTGTIAPLGDVIHVSAKALDTNTAMIIGGVTMDIPRTNAVDELLAKGVAGCGGAAATTPNPLQKTSSPPLQTTAADVRTAQTTLGDFLIQINHCGSQQTMNGTRITCYGTVVNQSSSPEQFGVHALKTYMIDDLGGQSTNIDGYVGVGVTIGSLARWSYMNELFGQLLQPGLPVALELSGDRMREGAKSVSIVLVTGDGQTILRNIVVR